MVEACPGASRQSRAPNCVASSCLPRSVFSTFIWFDGRQKASAALSTRWDIQLEAIVAGLEAAASVS